MSNVVLIIVVVALGLFILYKLRKQTHELDDRIKTLERKQDDQPEQDNWLLHQLLSGKGVFIREEHEPHPYKPIALEQGEVTTTDMVVTHVRYDSYSTEFREIGPYQTVTVGNLHVQDLKNDPERVRHADLFSYNRDREIIKIIERTHPELTFKTLQEIFTIPTNK